MQKAYVNVSAVAKMTGRPMPEGWRQFHGSDSELDAQTAWLQQNPSASVEDFKQQFYPILKPKPSGDTRTKWALNFTVAQQYAEELKSAA